MSFITELDVINEMLSALGESPVNALDDDHPLISAGRRMLKVANLREQTKSWWFNKELVRLDPDPTSGYIYVPEDSIRVDPSRQTLNYVQRGRRLYNTAANGQDAYKFDRAVLCTLIRLIPFEDLPATAQVVVSYAAQLDFQKAYDADATKYQMLMQSSKEATITLNAEHTRNVGANMLRRPGMLAAFGDPEGFSNLDTIGGYSG